jgi:hypothetical protein
MEFFYLLCIVVAAMFGLAYLLKHFTALEKLRGVAESTRTEIARREADYKRKYG